jgi:hypothetical protein
MGPCIRVQVVGRVSLMRFGIAIAGVVVTCAALATLLLLPQRPASYSCPSMPIVNLVHPAREILPRPDYFDVNRQCNSDARARGVVSLVLVALTGAVAAPIFIRRKRHRRTQSSSERLRGG